MKLKIPALCFASLMLAAPLLRCAEPNTLSRGEKFAGWKLLFDGQSLKGWRGYKGETPGPGWKVQDGALVLTEKRTGDLVTAEAFGDFELLLEWKVTKGANSGIIYRVGLGDAHSYDTGPEYQVLDNIEGGDRFDPKHRAGALYDLIAPPNDVTKPVGEWNVARIVVKGWHVEHWLNGVKLLATDLASPEGKAMIAASKFKTFPKFATVIRGHIALQDHGNVVSYRNIRIRELK